MHRKGRYGYLTQFVASSSAKVILEIGTWKAKNAVLMIKESLKNHRPEDVYYYGFDLFEQMDQSTFEYEYSKWPPHISAVRSRLDPIGINYELIQGNTRLTIPTFLKDLRQTPDLIYIDGGHSVETIRSDWENLSSVVGKNTIVLFDDYYLFKDGSKMDGVGCNLIIDSLDANIWSVQVLENCDTFGNRMVHFVKVERVAG